MSIDLFSGEVNDEPVFIDAQYVHTPRPISALQAGEHGFASIDELWVPPHNNVAHIDTEGQIFTLQQLEDSREDELDYARIVNFKGAYMVDVHHIMEHCGVFIDESFKIQRLTPYDYEDMEEDATVIGGLIRIRDQLELFNDLLVNTYGVTAQLPAIEIGDPAEAPRSTND